MYVYDSIYAGKKAWRREDSAYYIWWDVPGAAWILSVLLGTQGAAYWAWVNPSQWGPYQPQGTATGIATVANLE